MLIFCRLLAFAFIVTGSIFFGYLELPTEMGLAIVAGAIALAFAYIDKLDWFKAAGIEAKMRQLDAIVAKGTEPPGQSERSFVQPMIIGTDPDTDNVIKALGSEKYLWRYFGGIAEDTQLPKEKIQKALDWLVENQLAINADGKHGSIWGLSAEGRSLLAAVVEREKNSGA